MEAGLFYLGLGVLFCVAAVFWGFLADRMRREEDYWDHYEDDE